MDAFEDLRSLGERLEQLLASLKSSLAQSQYSQVEAAIRVVTDLYGAALERMVAISGVSSQGGDALLRKFAADDLVSSVLVVHGLHPESTASRLNAALRVFQAKKGGQYVLVSLDEEKDRAVVKIVPALSGVKSVVEEKLREELSIALGSAVPELDVTLEVDWSQHSNQAGDRIAVRVPVSLGTRRS
jgi:hypothetical protein